MSTRARCAWLRQLTRVCAARARAGSRSTCRPTSWRWPARRRLVFEAPPTPLRDYRRPGRVRAPHFGPGDLITINAGTDNGIEVGQEYYARRALPRERRAASAATTRRSIQTSGWIRIYAVDDAMSLATIIHAVRHDRGRATTSSRSSSPTVPTPSPDRPAAQRGNYGRVLIGNDNRSSFGRGRLLRRRPRQRSRRDGRRAIRRLSRQAHSRAISCSSLEKRWRWT